MNSVLQIDKTEWEAFLQKLSEFEKKYELLLSKMDAIQSRLDREEKEAKRDYEKGSATSRVEPSMPPPESRLEGTSEKERSSFLTRLEKKLRAPNKLSPEISKVPNIPQNTAYCPKCGFQIMQPTRSCQHCAFDFGKLVCSCGRELFGSEKFCDRCGRTL